MIGEQPYGDRRCEGQTAEPPPLSHYEERQNRVSTPLKSLSLDTILTAGDLKRLLKIVTSSGLDGPF